MRAVSAREQRGYRTSRTHPLAYLVYVLLAGLCIQPTAQAFIVPHRELTVVERGFLPLIEKLHPSFPNPVPDGTYVPYWALINVTVRYSPFVFIAYRLYITGPGRLGFQPIVCHWWYEPRLSPSLGILPPSFQILLK